MVNAAALEWSQFFSQTVTKLNDPLFYILIGLIVLDYVTGVCVAVSVRKLSSKIGFHGIAKKVVVVVLVVVSSLLDQYFLKGAAVLQTVTTIFYLTNECISLFENAGKLNIPLPQTLKEFLQALEKNQK